MYCRYTGNLNARALGDDHFSGNAVIRPLGFSVYLLPGYPYRAYTKRVSDIPLSDKIRHQIFVHTWFQT
jgi:hypothetical protein